MRFFITICLATLLFACGDSAEKPVTEKTNILNTLAGVWFHDCFSDYNDQFYSSVEDEYKADLTFTYKWTVYDANDCASNAIARVTYTGTYELHDPFVADVNFIPGKEIQAWQIDFHIQDVIVSGYGHIGVSSLTVRNPGIYYDIIAVEGDEKYDDSMVEDSQDRPTSFDFVFTRANAFLTEEVAPKPDFAGPIVEANLVGNWDYGCNNDNATDGGLEYREQTIYRMSEISGGGANTYNIEIDSLLWADDNCLSSEVARLRLSGTYSIVDRINTAHSKVEAVIIEINLGPDAIYTGDQIAAELSMPYAGDVKGRFYMLMFHDPDYNMLFVNGWREESILDLPDDIVWALLPAG